MQNVKQNLTKIDNSTLKDIGVALSINSIFKEAWQAVAAVLPQGQIHFDNLKAAFESTRFAKSMRAKGNDPLSVDSVIDFSLAGNLSEMLLSQAPVVNNPGSKGR